MNARKLLLAGLVACGGWTATGLAQVPGIPATPAAAAPGVPAAAPIPGAVDPPPGKLWSFLGLTKEHKEACRRKICRTQLGAMLTSMTTPISTLSGGIIPPFCPPNDVDPKDLAKPAESAEGAAARAKKVAAEAAARKAAVRYLGTLDCARFPEAKDALIASLRGDPIECVRFEAAVALGNGCCCNKETIESLRIAASCGDSDGFPKEQSDRIRVTAMGALQRCLACFDEPVKESPAPEKDKPAPEPEKAQPSPQPEKSGSEPKSDPDKKDAAKPAGTVAKPARPTQMAYYAAIRQVPLAAIVAEARKTVEKMNANVSQAQFVSGQRSLTSLIEHASGQPDLSPMTVEYGVPTPRAEVVSPRPANLWDYVVRGDTGRPVHGPTVVVTTSPEPSVAAVALPKVEMTTKLPPVTPAPSVVVTQTMPTIAPRETVKPLPSLTVTENRRVPSAAGVVVTPARPIVPIPNGPPLTPVTESTSLKPTPALPKPVVAPPIVVPPPSLPLTPIQATVPKPAAPVVVPAKVVTPAPQPVLTPAKVVVPAPSPAFRAYQSAQSAIEKERIADKLTTDDFRASPEIALELLKTAKGVDDPAVRKTCIRALVRGQANTPIVRAGLEKLTEDPVPAIRVEAAIALARLQVMQSPKSLNR